MSDLDRVVALSVTVACTVGLEPLMFPTGLTEVMVTPLEPPRLAPLLAPDLVLGLALPEVLRLLDLPMRTPFLTGHVLCSRTSLPQTISEPRKWAGTAACFYSAPRRREGHRSTEPLKVGQQYPRF
jgi:hypothetical protein